MKRRHALAWLVAMGALVLLAEHTAAADAENIRDALKLAKADRIVVTYAPQADFNAQVVQKELKDPKAVQAWLKAIGEIPAAGPGLMIKLSGDAPEHLIEFYAGQQRLGSLRMKAGKLDAPTGSGWDFYDAEDKAFTALVEQLFQPANK